MKADAFFAAIDERQERALSMFPEAAGTGLCASCGKHPPVSGFSMCVDCRRKAGLPVDARSLAEFEKRAAAEKAYHDKAHADFAARQKRETKKMTRTPRKVRTCSCGFTTDWAPSMAMHLEVRQGQRMPGGHRGGHTDACAA